uniref:Uncharacterized protein n=1 Tax=Oryza rufipogon TaxID=4529 RepID=A0A0E0PZ99_ORYRU
MARLAGGTRVAAADDTGRRAGVASSEAGGWLGAAGRRCAWAVSGEDPGRPCCGGVLGCGGVLASPRSLVGGDGRPRDQWDDIVQDMIVIGNGPGRLDYWGGCGSLHDRGQFYISEVILVTCAL